MSFEIQADHKVDISGVDKVKLLAALWENQQAARFFASNMVKSPEFDLKKAEKALLGYIDYFQGRAIKADLREDTVDFASYDRDATKKAAEIVEELRKTSSTQSDPEDDDETDISGIDKVKLLQALWENQQAARFFSMNMMKSPDFDSKKAEKALSVGYIDYFQGRAIKADLRGDKVNFELYDRDAPKKAAEIVKSCKTSTLTPKPKSKESQPPRGSRCFYCHSDDATTFCHDRYSCSSCFTFFEHDQAAKSVYGNVS